jgi:ankyrin repeat protein
MNLVQASQAGWLTHVRAILSDPTSTAASATIIDEKFQPSYPDKIECTALFAATKHNHLQVMYYLLQCGANVEPGEDISTSPLAIAIKENNVCAVRLLLWFGATIESFYHKFNTNVLNFVVNDNDEMIMLLIPHGVTLMDVSCPSLDWNKTLDNAIRNGSYNMSRRLLQLGVPINTMDVETNQSALQYACSQSKWKIARLLLIEHNTDASMKDIYGMTPLHYVCARDTGTYSQGDLDRDIISSLLQHGANVNEQNNKGWTALHYSTHHVDIEDTRLLLMHENTNIHLKTQQNETPLSLCFTINHEVKDIVAVARLLLDFGACNDNPQLDAMMWDWNGEHHFQDLRYKYIMNWYYFTSKICFQESSFLSMAIAAIAHTLVHSYIPRNALLPNLGETSISSTITSAVVSVIYDLLHCNVITTLNWAGTCS